MEMYSGCSSYLLMYILDVNLHRMLRSECKQNAKIKPVQSPRITVHGNLLSVDYLPDHDKHTGWMSTWEITENSNNAK